MLYFLNIIIFYNLHLFIVEINNIIKPRIQIILKGNSFIISFICKIKIKISLSGIHRDGYLVAARRSHVVKCCGRITCRGGSGSGASRYTEHKMLFFLIKRLICISICFVKYNVVYRATFCCYIDDKNKLYNRNAKSN